MVWEIVKIGVLIFMVIYIVFAFVIYRQVVSMTRTLEVGFERALKTFVFGHFLFAVITFIVAFTIL